jgi:hypothetical protein
MLFTPCIFLINNQPTYALNEMQDAKTWSIILVLNHISLSALVDVLIEVMFVQGSCEQNVEFHT